MHGDLEVEPRRSGYPQDGFNHNSFRYAVLKTHADAIYIVDGIISPESWHQSRVKVLFILKEANGYDGSNIAELIRKAIVEKPKSKLWCRPTFHNIGRWAYGLQRCGESICGFKEAHRNRKSALLASAFINLKKTTGGRRATAEVRAFAEAHGAFLREQILSITPDVVVMGGTYDIIKEHVFPELEKASYRVHLLHGVPFINAFHPACTKVRKALYEQVLDSYQDYRQQAEVTVPL
ncbi:hypothetical protein ACJRW5_15465 [Pseudomonas sp. SH1-B]